MLEIGGTSAEGASVKRRRRQDRGAEGTEGVGCGERYPPSCWERGLGRGPCPLTRKIFDFSARKGEFWCILGATFAVELNENWLGY